MLPLHTVGFHLFTQHLFLCRIQVIGKRLILDSAAIARDLQLIADLLALHIVVGIDIQRMVVFIGLHECAKHFVDVETRNDIKIQYSVIHRLDAILEIKIPRSESARRCQLLTIQPVEEDAPVGILGNLRFLICLRCRIRYVLHRVDLPAVHDIERRKRPRIEVQLIRTGDTPCVLHALCGCRIELLLRDLLTVWKYGCKFCARVFVGQIVPQVGCRLQQLHGFWHRKIHTLAIFGHSKYRLSQLLQNILTAHHGTSGFFCGLRTGSSCSQSLMYSCTAAGTTFS